MDRGYSDNPIFDIQYWVTSSKLKNTQAHWDFKIPRIPDSSLCGCPGSVSITFSQFNIESLVIRLTINRLGNSSWWFSFKFLQRFHNLGTKNVASLSSLLSANTVSVIEASKRNLNHTDGTVYPKIYVPVHSSPTISEVSKFQSSFQSFVSPQFILLVRVNISRSYLQKQTHVLPDLSIRSWIRTAGAT